MFDAGPSINKYNIETGSVDRLFYDTETVTINSTKAGANSKFETKAKMPLSGAGKLEFSMSIPSTFSANGEYAYGNAPTKIYLGNGDSRALEFTVIPNVVKGYTESATLSVNGKNLCSYPTGREAQKWTKIECSIDNLQHKAYVTCPKAENSYISSRQK